MSNRIPMGVEARDRVSGFKGIVTGHADYMTGCDQYLLIPKVKDDGTKQDGVWFDEQRLEVLESDPLTLDNSKGNGADVPAPIKG